MKISTKARNAICLGTLCSVAYLAVYIARNILGAVTPKMTADAFSLDYIGDITAIYLLAYACGQLINGTIGDWIKAKYMICIGLLSAGIANIIFVRIAAYPGLRRIAVDVCRLRAYIEGSDPFCLSRALGSVLLCRSIASRA